MAFRHRGLQTRYDRRNVPLGSIIGHAPVLALLRRAVARGRIPQSLLFAGPAGVGKHATALALAQAINCPTRRRQAGDDACGQCNTCLRIARGQHSDVTVIEKGDQASIKIDVLRKNLLEVIGYRPFEAERRVFVLDPADDIVVQGQDALLKTLEEPPPSAILILISEYPDTLLPTIQSRCRRVRFGALAEADVARVLTAVENIAPDRAAALAAVSGGSVGRALVEHAGEAEDDRALALALLDAARGRHIGAKLGAAAEFAKVAKDERARDVLSGRLTVLSALVRDLGVIASGAPSALANSDLERNLRALGSAFDLRRVTGAFETIVQAQDAIGRNASPKLVADWVAATI